jgi:pyruvate dehydrogenase E2 component (dihydrolipoamide acetyltransferase)
MEEGTILAWLKKVGEEVSVGEELVEIETDKANMAYEADVAGTLTEILAKEGETLPIGEPIARVDGDGEGPSAQAAGPGADDGASEPPAPTVESRAPIAPPQAGERVKASPLARRLAKERGLDLTSVQGSGPGGRIVKADVEGADGAPAPLAPSAAPAAAAPVGAPETAKGEVRVQEPNKVQQTIARRMAESKATAPHFYLSTEVDMSAAVAARAKIKATAKEGELVPSFNDMVLKAAAIALTELPKANGAYRDGHFELYSRVNVGIAVAAEEALVVPTVFDADKKGLRQIATESRALAAKVREGTITPPELSGATFTVSNLGMFGITSFAAVINSPQAGILAVGAIREVPVVREGEIVPGHLMALTLACDHRILYGAEGAELLARVRALLEEPVGLAL